MVGCVVTRVPNGKGIMYIHAALCTNEVSEGLSSQRKGCPPRACCDLSIVLPCRGRKSCADFSLIQTINSLSHLQSASLDSILHGLHSRVCILSHVVSFSCIPDRHQSKLPPIPPFVWVRVTLFPISFVYVRLDVELPLHPSTCNLEVVGKTQELLGTPWIIVCSNRECILGDSRMPGCPLGYL